MNVDMLFTEFRETYFVDDYFYLKSKLIIQFV